MCTPGAGMGRRVLLRDAGAERRPRERSWARMSGAHRRRRRHWTDRRRRCAGPPAADDTCIALCSPLNPTSSHTSTPSATMCSSIAPSTSALPAGPQASAAQPLVPPTAIDPAAELAIAVLSTGAAAEGGRCPDLLQGSIRALRSDLRSRCTCTSRRAAAHGRRAQGAAVAGTALQSIDRFYTLVTLVAPLSSYWNTPQRTRRSQAVGSTPGGRPRPCTASLAPPASSWRDGRALGAA